MKLPSIFRLPKYQRFTIEPRYHDPIKDDIEARTNRIKSEIAFEKKHKDTLHGQRLAGAFDHYKPKKDISGLIRTVVAAVLFGGTVGFLYFGVVAIYMVSVLVMFIYLAYKLKFRR